MKIFGKIAFSVLSLTFLTCSGSGPFDPPLPPDEGEGDPTSQIFTAYEESESMADWGCSQCKKKKKKDKWNEGVA